jgi:RHS repeat-associated protein
MKTDHIYIVCIAALLLPLQALSENKSAVEPQVLSLPTGPGSIEGLGESFEPQLNTGTAVYSVSFKAPVGITGHQPTLSLNYNSGYGNSIIGMGWRLNIPSIQRQTDKGLPGYTVEDTFIHSGNGELVEVEAGRYRGKIEANFDQAIRTGDTWLVKKKNGNQQLFGTTAESRQANELGVFAWHIDSSIDINGNEIRYFYEQHGNQQYLTAIEYGAASPYIQSIHLFYETRPDTLSDYRSRSRIQTDKRLSRVEMRSQGELIRTYHLGYHSNSDLSLLARIQETGADSTITRPAMSFEYSRYGGIANANTRIITNPPPSGVNFSSANTDLVDINGDSLPDLVETSLLHGHRFFLNEGRGSMADDAERPLTAPPYYLDSSAVMMADMDGNGLADMLVTNTGVGFRFGYYKNRGDVGWSSDDWSPYRENADFSFENSDVRLVDVNNDKLIDVIRSNSFLSSYHIWLNPGEGDWPTEYQETFLPDGFRSLSDDTTKLGDLNGDRMQDLVYIRDGHLSYYPSKGNGNFDEPVPMAGAPIGITPADVRIVDINQDGLADLAVVGTRSVRLWFNRGNGSFHPEQKLENTPSTFGTSAFRFADINGDGFGDLYITNGDSSDPHQYVDFNNGIHPNLLTGIKNGLGQETTIEYKSSTEDYLADRDAGTPWTRKLPFPVQVVSRVTVRDNNSGQEYVTDYHYRDGYYDGDEKEFRGFGEVRKIEHGGVGAPTLKSEYSFDVGDVHECTKGMVTRTALLEADGSQSPPSGLFQVTEHQLNINPTLLTGVNPDETVSYAYTQSATTHIYEGGTQPVTLMREWQQDQYGNTIADYDYGIVLGDNQTAGNDELLTDTEYWLDETNWILDRPTKVHKRGLNGEFVSLQRLSYDAKGNLKKDERSSDGVQFIPIIRNDYDSYGNIIKITDANDHWRTIDYDTEFHTFPIRETIAELDLTLTASYDTGQGVMTSFTEPNGHTTDFGYDPLGRLIRIVKPGDSHTLPTQSFEYQLGDPVSSILTRSREVSGQTGTYDSIAWFDGLGRKLQTRSEAEDGNWIVADAVAFNPRKGVQRQWLPYFAADRQFSQPSSDLTHTLIEYDAKGRPIRETNPDGSQRTTAYAPLTRIEFDEEDNNPDGPHHDTPHTFINDGRERLVEVQERNGDETYVTRYGYDGLDSLIRITDARQNLKTIQFDGLGRKTAMDDPDKGPMSYHYDPAGNLIRTLDAKGQTVEYQYDPANRILSERHQGVEKVRYHYDADRPSGLIPLPEPEPANTLGRLSWIEDPAGREVYAYDARGNITKKLRELDGLSFINRMEYDAMDRLARLVYPDGHEVAYRYNPMNQLEAIPGFVANIDYTPAGQKARFTFANGVTSNYNYDERQRLSALQTARDTALYQHQSYHYDRASNITRIADLRPDKTPEDRSADYAYDDLYRLTQATSPAWSRNYKYDPIGNMTYKSDLGEMGYGEGQAGPHALTSAGGIDYSYDANGNISKKSPSPSGRGVGVRAIESQAFDYTFDPKDRLARVDRNDGAIIEYAYDSGFDRRRKQINHDGQTSTTLYPDQYTELRDDRLIRQIFAGNRLVARVETAPFHPAMLNGWDAPLTASDLDTSPPDGEITLAEIRAQGTDAARLEYPELVDALAIYHQGRENDPDRLSFATIAQAMHEIGDLPGPSESRTLFYLPDHLGSPSLVLDGDGAVVENSVFYPYGQERARDGGYESEYRFTGKELDGETGLHYFGARYYDSVTGRFVSVDPLPHAKPLQSPIGSFSSIYRYGANNPISYIDIVGLNETLPSHKVENSDLNGVCTSIEGQEFRNPRVLATGQNSDATYTAALWQEIAEEYGFDLAQKGIAFAAAHREPFTSLKGYVYSSNAVGYADKALGVFGFGTEAVSEAGGVDNVLKALSETPENLRWAITEATVDDWIEIGIQSSTQITAASINTITSLPNAALEALTDGGMSMSFSGSQFRSFLESP